MGGEDDGGGEEELSPGQLQAIEDVFRSFDADGDGQLTRIEISAMLASLGLPIGGGADAGAAAEALLVRADCDGDGLVSLQEFTALFGHAVLRSPRYSEGELASMFRAFDRDGNGFITAAELAHTMAKLGHKLSVRELSEMIREADEDGDGRISFDEFVRALGSSNGGGLLDRVLGAAMAAKLAWTLVKGLATGAMVGVAMLDELGSLGCMTGRSMLPTLRPGDGSALASDIVLLNKIAGHDFHYSRGDVVVFRSPTEPKSSYVKRLIGLQGDTVTIPGASSSVLVPRGHCWVEGDNASLSVDSRSFGPIPMGLLQGKVTRVLWPPPRFGPVQSVQPVGRVVASDC